MQQIENSSRWGCDEIREADVGHRRGWRLALPAVPCTVFEDFASQAGGVDLPADYPFCRLKPAN